MEKSADIVDRVRRVLKALEENHLDAKELGLSLQCPHGVRTKRVLTVAEIPVWLCEDCYAAIIEETTV